MTRGGERGLAPRGITPFLAARDLEQTAAFYAELLGFRVALRHPPERPTLLVLESEADEGRSVELLFDTSLWSGPPALTGQLVLDLGELGATEPSRVLRLLERIGERAELLWGPEVYGYGRREASVRDPNGYAVVLSERTDEPPTCEP